jgi:hypothetical protein
LPKSAKTRWKRHYEKIAVGAAPGDFPATCNASAFVGVVAGFWHISWIAGTGMLVSGLVAVGVHAAGYMDLKRDETPTAQERGGPAE